MRPLEAVICRLFGSENYLFVSKMEKEGGEGKMKRREGEGR